MRFIVSKIRSRQKGITGLETAIILIAFVMVASVLAYVVLTAGLFSAQKAKDAIYSGLDEVRSTLLLKGDVLLKMENGVGTKLIFTVGVGEGSNPIDFTDTSGSTSTTTTTSPTTPTTTTTTTTPTTTSSTTTSSGTSSVNNVVVISYHDSFQNVPSLDWTLTKLTSFGDDNLLDPNELFLITVDLTKVNDQAQSDNQKLKAYHPFTIEVKPPKGAVLTIERTVPARVNDMVSLY